MLSKKNILIITNNSKVLDKYAPYFGIEFIETSNMLQVFIKARNYIHLGYKLLTHPLSGSLKPNQTPYKSIILLKENTKELNFEVLNMIENSIECFYKFYRRRGMLKFSNNIHADFKTVDLSLIDNCLSKYI